MISEIEKLQNRRRHNLMAVGVVYPLWLIPQLDRFDASPIIHTIRDVGVLLFTCVMVWIMFISVRLSKLNAKEQATFDDELVKANRAKSLRNGYLAFCVVALLLLLFSDTFGFTGHDVALLVLVIGLPITFISFALYERNGA